MLKNFSLLPKELSILINECNSAWHSLGSDKFARPEIESPNKIFRRSLYFVKNLPIGSILKETDIRRIRPGHGLPPKFLNDLIGKRLIRNVESGDPVTLDCFDDSLKDFEIE